MFTSLFGTSSSLQLCVEFRKINFVCCDLYLIVSGEGQVAELEEFIQSQHMPMRTFIDSICKPLPNSPFNPAAVHMEQEARNFDYENLLFSEHWK